jgi:hypothetical protein
MYDIVKQQMVNLTKIEEKLKKDDDEKYACNKDNVLEYFQKDIDFKNGMKKKQKDIAEKFTITDYIHKPTSSGDKDKYKEDKKNFEKLRINSLKYFMEIDEEEKKKIDDEDEKWK